MNLTEIRNSIVKAMQEKGNTINPFIENIIDQYIDMIELQRQLKEKVDEDGVSFNVGETPRKNENINVLVALNKQSLILLTKLGIEPSMIKNVGGEDV